MSTAWQSAASLGLLNCEDCGLLSRHAAAHSRALGALSRDLARTILTMEGLAS
jgi:hypothetical protein